MARKTGRNHERHCSVRHWRKCFGGQEVHCWAGLCSNKQLYGYLWNRGSVESQGRRRKGQHGEGKKLGQQVKSKSAETAHAPGWGWGRCKRKVPQTSKINGPVRNTGLEGSRRESSDYMASGPTDSGRDLAGPESGPVPQEISYLECLKCKCPVTR